MRRVGFLGSSGTGKTTLTRFVRERYGLEENPVGSRSTAKAMGFASPYDVDKAGKRREFQRSLLVEKCLWEARHTSFVTDRTVADVLAYTMLHGVQAVDLGLFDVFRRGLGWYTHVVYCPVGVFCDLGDDQARFHDATYQELYDVTVKALIDRYLPKQVELITLSVADLEERKQIVCSAIG
jgi:hypothetical protein